MAYTEQDRRRAIEQGETLVALVTRVNEVVIPNLNEGKHRLDLHDAAISELRKIRSETPDSKNIWWVSGGSAAAGSVAGIGSMSYGAKLAALLVALFHP